MRVVVRILALLLVATFVMAPLAAFATEADTEEPTPTSTFAPGMAPAVEAPPVDVAERDDPWTARYLAPVLLVGGVLVAIGYFATYGARVRGKYEVVD